MRLFHHCGLLLAAALLIATPGCDNPIPIFGGGWPPPGTGAEGSLGQEAFLPADGAWLLSAAPVVQKSYPTGTNVHAKSPIVIRFSESVAQDSLNNAFRLVPSSVPASVPFTTQLLGDGRIVVLLPAIDLTASEQYTVSIADSAAITDLTGQALSTTGTLTTFTVAATNPTTPKLLASWPEDGATNMSAIGQLVAVFDRPMNATSFNATSWVVTVDSTAPVLDPDPAPVTIASGFFPIPDTRVWTWSSEDADGVRQDLGAGLSAQLSLSPSTSTLISNNGNPLPTTVIDFDLAPMTVPQSSALGTQGMVSSPSDAIGIANLTAGNPKALTLTTQIPGSLAGDRVVLYLFGATFDENGDPAQTIAFERSVTLSADADQAVFTLGDLDLVAKTSPLKARFADGSVSFALQVRRGSATTAVRNLDVNPVLGDIQDPLLDTVAPTVDALFGDDGTGLVIADQRGLQLAGRASEKLRAAEVSTGLGNNGTEALVLGSEDDGSFLTAPVPGVDVIALGSQPVAFTLTVYDAAMNAAAVATTGSYRQVGVVGPTALTPGGTIAVEVYDAISKAPIVGARAYIHADDGLTYPLISNSTTLSTGLTSVTSPGSGGHILTVVADGYDLVSLMNVESSRVSIPLTPSVSLPAAVGGVLSATSQLAGLTLANLTLHYADSRRSPGLVGLVGLPAVVGLIDGMTCSSNPFGDGSVTCQFGPAAVRAGRLGALAALGGNFTLPQGSFSASAALQSFELVLPLAPLPSAGAQAAEIQTGLLNESGADVLGLPAELTVLTLNAAGINGLDLMSLADDAKTIGAPLVTGETTIPGLPGSLPIAQGVSYDQGGSLWTVRTAVPGAVLSGGSLAGVVDTDLWVQAALQDTNTARSARRVRMSDFANLPVPNQLDLVDAPQVLSPATMTSGVGYDLVIDNVISDAEATDALIQVEVVDAAGRAWRLYARDPADGNPARVHLVDLGAFDTGLASGLTVARGLAVGGAGLNFGNLLWADIERNFEVYAQGPLVTYLVP